MKITGFTAPGWGFFFWLLWAGLANAAPVFEQTDVFVSGRDGYFAYRIPAIGTAPDGSLLAVAEARKYNLQDPGFEKQDIDLVMKRSTDSGRTWSAMKIIEDPGERWSAANPAVLVDRDTRRVWLFYLRGKPERNTYTARAGTDDIQILARTSDAQMFDSGYDSKIAVEQGAATAEVHRLWWFGLRLGLRQPFLAKPELVEPVGMLAADRK